MITKVVNYSEEKCWKLVSNLSNVDFNMINILFGHNGSGKSSLASIIANAYLTDGDISALRFFNSNYVTSKLLLEDKSGIRGVVSNFGEKDVDIEKQMEANNQKIREIEAEVQKQKVERERIIDDSETLIKEIVKRRKDKNTKIHNKPEGKTIEEKVVLWIKDYDDAYKLFPNEDYNAITGNADFLVESEELNSLVLPTLPTLKESMLSDLAFILETEYKNVDVPEVEVVSWLENGMHIHADKDRCEFCGANIDIALIKRKVDLYLNDERHKATLVLSTYRKELDDTRRLGKNLIDNQVLFIKVLGITEQDIKFSAISDSVRQIEIIIEHSLDYKVGKMEDSITLDMETLARSIQNLIDAMNKLNIIKKQSSQNLLEKINRLEMLVKGAIGLEISNSKLITENLGKITEYNKKIQDYSKCLKNLNEENDQLLKKKSDLSDFATYLNEVLTNLNLNFSLEPYGKIYVLRHVDGSPLKLEDISDGEKNLLTLIYFYYEMLDDDQNNFKNSIKLIVIDDPISSLDDGNKFFISELIKSILNQSKIQVFVMSHSWDDFCNLAYGRNEKGTSLFEIKKQSNIGNIYEISKGKLLKPYMMLYREVNDFSRLSLEDINDEDALHMPNTIRRVLEEYIKFRVNVDFATQKSVDDVARAIFGCEFSILSNNKKKNLNQLLAICNILSHKANQPKNPTEIHESAKFLILSITTYDKYHHCKMIGDM